MDTAASIRRQTSVRDASIYDGIIILSYISPFSLTQQCKVGDNVLAELLIFPKKISINYLFSAVNDHLLSKFSEIIAYLSCRLQSVSVIGELLLTWRLTGASKQA